MTKKPVEELIHFSLINVNKLNNLISCVIDKLILKYIFFNKKNSLIINVIRITKSTNIMFRHTKREKHIKSQNMEKTP